MEKLLAQEILCIPGTSKHMVSIQAELLPKLGVYFMLTPVYAGRQSFESGGEVAGVPGTVP